MRFLMIKLTAGHCHGNRVADGLSSNEAIRSDTFNIWRFAPSGLHDRRNVFACGAIPCDGS